MNPLLQLRTLAEELLTAFQFLTRIPLPSVPFTPDSLSRSIKFFPVVGLAIGASAALLQHLLLPHLSRPLTALLLLTYLVLISGCFHEDALADTADGFGGGWNRDQILVILRDSRIGSYGATALILSLLARYLLLATLPLEHFTSYLISAQVLGRWTSLPLSYFLPPARASDGQGARVAQLTSLTSLITGTVFTLAVVLFALRSAAIAPIFIALLTTILSGRFYLRKIAGVTGDCFGATNQLSEISVYLCGVWHA